MPRHDSDRLGREQVRHGGLATPALGAQLGKSALSAGLKHETRLATRPGGQPEDLPEPHPMTQGLDKTPINTTPSALDAHFRDAGDQVYVLGSE